MTKLQRFIPQTPDPYLRQADQLGSVKFGHLNALVDAINSTIYGDYLQLAGDGPMSSTLRALEDPEGNLAKLYLAIDKTAILGPLKIGDITSNVPSAILQIDSTTQGVLFPRMSLLERDAIVSPEVSLIIFNTDDNELQLWDGIEWTSVGGGLEFIQELYSDATQATSAITPLTAAVNANIAIIPKGTGAITAQIPDGTVTGGNARGQYSVDLQRLRNNANQVAQPNKSFIGGGENNRIQVGYGAMEGSVIVGGVGNFVGANYAFIGGGVGNGLSGNDNLQVIVGGQNNQITAAGGSFIGGGQQNNISGGGFGFSVIAGGIGNIVTNGTVHTISGGQSNTASTGTHATVVGGYLNTASGQYSVAGGQFCIASGLNSIAFGRQHSVSGVGAFSIGGYNNTVSGYRAGAFGSNNDVSSQFGIILGHFSNSYLYGQNVIANGSFGNAKGDGDAQQSYLTARKFDDLTTGGTTVLSLDGTGIANLIIPSGTNRVWNVQVKTVAVVIGTSGTTTGVSVGDSLMQDDKILFSKTGGVSSVVGTTSQDFISSTSLSSASMSYSAGASQELSLTFTAPTFAGGGSVTCRVVSKVSLVEVAY